MAKLVLAQQRDQEPECVLFMLLQMNQNRASDEIHALRVAQHFTFTKWLEDAYGREDSVKHILPRLVLLEELQVGERPAHILPDLRHHGALSSPRSIRFIKP